MAPSLDALLRPYTHFRAQPAEFGCLKTALRFSFLNVLEFAGRSALLYRRLPGALLRGRRVSALGRSKSFRQREVRGRAGGLTTILRAPRATVASGWRFLLARAAGEAWKQRLARISRRQDRLPHILSVLGEWREAYDLQWLIVKSNISM